MKFCWQVLKERHDNDKVARVLLEQRNRTVAFRTRCRLCRPVKTIVATLTGKKLEVTGRKGSVCLVDSVRISEALNSTTEWDILLDISGTSTITLGFGLAWLTVPEIIQVNPGPQRQVSGVDTVAAGCSSCLPTNGVKAPQKDYTYSMLIGSIYFTLLNFLHLRTLLSPVGGGIGLVASLLVGLI